MSAASQIHHLADCVPWLLKSPGLALRLLIQIMHIMYRNVTMQIGRHKDRTYGPGVQVLGAMKLYVVVS